MSIDTSTRLVETSCLNCGSPPAGKYCPACGQKVGPPPLALHDFVHELVHEFLHFDSKIWRTLVLLLFSPGALTTAYIAGQRVRYVGPVRLFLVASLLLFALLAAAPGGGFNATVSDRSAVEAELAIEPSAEMSSFERALRRGVLRTAQDPAHFKHNGLKALSKSVFLLVPLFALLTWRLFKKELPYYVGHLYFSLHFHAFVFLTLGAASAVASIGPLANEIAMTIFAAAFLVYFYAALRRTFRGSWWKTFAGGTLIFSGYAVLNGVVAIAILLITLVFL